MGETTVLVLCLLLTVASSATISLNKCCPESQIYDLGNNACLEVSTPNPIGNWPSPISSSGGRSISDDFQVIEQMTYCPDGFIAQSTTDFEIDVTGKLTIPNEGSNYGSDPGGFCLENVSPSESEAKMAVRFCLEDPCNSSDCIHKCCPLGWQLSNHIHGKISCVKSENLSNFEVEFFNESGHSLDVPSNSYVIQHGVLPICEYSFIQLKPSEGAHYQFHLLPSFHMYIHAYPEDMRNVSNYCVDNIDDSVGNATEKIGLICHIPSELEGMMGTVDSTYAYLLFVSAFFLLVTFVVYAIIPEIRNIHGATIMCHSIALAISFICFAIMKLQKDIENGCHFLAGLSHFCFLSAFTWLSAMGFDIWWTLTDLRPRSSTPHSGSRIGHRFAYYSIYAWGVPLIFTLVGQIIDHTAPEEESEDDSYVLRPQFYDGSCWFRDKMAGLPYLYGPIGLILLSNLTFFIMTAIRLNRIRRDTAFATSNRKKQNFVVIFSLFLLMGLTWIFEIFAVFLELSEESTMFTIPIDILNILTGVFIFVTFVCKKKVRRLLRKKFLPIERLVRGKHFALPSIHEGSASMNRSASFAKKTLTVTMSQLSTKSQTGLITV